MVLTMPTASFDALLQRSSALDNHIVLLLGSESYTTFDQSARIVASAAACSVAMDHGRGLRVLIASDLPAPAIGLMRLQFEALTRCAWILYAATDVQVEKLNAPLTLEAEKAANGLPMLTGMLAALKDKAPAAAVETLLHFKDVTAGALNSVVHGSIHALRRQVDGYPEPLLYQAVISSNALQTMCGMMFAILSGNPTITASMRQIQSAFKDCLPELLASSQSPR